MSSPITGVCPNETAIVLRWRTSVLVYREVPFKALLAQAHELELVVLDPSHVRIVVPAREPRLAP